MAQIVTSTALPRRGRAGLSHWLGTKIFNQPLAMRFDLLPQIRSAIDAETFDSQLDLTELSKFSGTRVARSGYRITDDHIALVPISGTLVDRGEWLGDYYGMMTSYEGIAEQMNRLGKDDMVKTIVLDIDSGGGMAAGLFDLCDVIASVGKTKRIVALAANMAASAAYAIAATADEVFVTSEGMVGSIGVVSMHRSYQRALDEAGIDTTFIYSGERKIDGNPFQQLSHGAQAELAAVCDRISHRFFKHVAKARDLDPDAVEAQKAGMYSGDQAVSAGLADGVKHFEEVLEHIRAKSKKRGSSTSKGGRSVTEAKAAGDRPDYDAVIAAALTTIASVQNKTAAIAASLEPQVAPVAAAPAPAAVDPRARIKAILGHEAAKGRDQLARTIALETEMTVEQAATLLQASPVEAAPEQPARDRLAAAMAQPGNAGGIKPEAAPTATTPANSFVAFYEKHIAKGAH